MATGIEHFKPSKALQANAQTLHEQMTSEYSRRDLKRLNELVMQSHGALTHAQVVFLEQVLGAQDKDYAALAQLEQLAAEIQKGPIPWEKIDCSDVRKTPKAIDELQDWCEKRIENYLANLDALDDRATELATHMGGLSKPEIEARAQEIEFLDRAQGYLAEFNMFAEELLAEIKEQQKKRQPKLWQERKRGDDKGKNGGPSQAI